MRVSLHPYKINTKNKHTKSPPFTSYNTCPVFSKDALNSKVTVNTLKILKITFAVLLNCILIK